jgi:multicomponent Na+:H+ antiporter subunit G
MSLQDLFAAFFVVAGLLWLTVGGIGLLRFPDFYTRLHPAGKADTFGAALLLLGLVVHLGWSLVSLKVVLIQGFILLANPAAAHAIGRAALRSGVAPWTGLQEEKR